MNDEAPKKSARRRWPLLVVPGVLIAVVAIVASLLTGSGEEPAVDARPRPELDPLTLSERVWAADGLTLFSNGGGLRLRDGVLLARTADGLQLLDVESGAKRWSQDQFADLPGQTVGYDSGAHQQLPPLVRHGDGLGVLVGYQEFDNCGLVEPGVALLSAETGGVVWQAPTMPAGCGGRTQTLWAADDTTALVGVESVGGDPDDAGQVRILAPGCRHRAAEVGPPGRVAARGRRWCRAGFGEESDAVRVGHRTRHGERTGPDHWTAQVEPCRPVPGRQRDAGRRRPGRGSDVRRVSGGTNRSGAGRRHRPRAWVLPDMEPGTCVADATLVACQAEPLRGGPRLVTFRAADRAVTTAPIEEHTTLECVVQGRISVTVRGRREPSVVTIDRTGNVIDKKPPGTLLAMPDMSRAGVRRSGK